MIRKRSCFSIIVFVICFSGQLFADSGDSLINRGHIEKKDRKFRVKIELKREFTNRGTPEETTKTSLRTDFLLHGVVTLIRLEIPFPDQTSDFEGSLFNPGLGDIKTRVGFRAFRLGIPIASFIELTFPTASPSDLGTGKYQCSPGLRTSIRLSKPDSVPQKNKFTFDVQVQQVFSYAGDTSRKDINYTKFEISFRYTWNKKVWLKLAVKPVLDWEQSCSTGAVMEFEPGWYISRHWSIWILGGMRLWGSSIPSTYDKRLTIGAAFIF